VPVEVGVLVGTGFGAWPVDCNEAPTEDRPALGNEFVVSELDKPDDEPMEPMPLMRLAYHSVDRSGLRRKRP
jgi:hypothetical protein